MTPRMGRVLFVFHHRVSHSMMVLKPQRGGGRYINGDRSLIRWGDTVANVILRMEPNSPLVYDMVLELHHPIMSMLGGNGGQLDI